ncbi:MAG: winged helix-turn-helix domain-containing protein [Methanomassiliicoccales archaeon]|jgi:DNA-binding transcriptional ArsR family regulator
MAQDAVLRELRSLREDIGQMGGQLVSMRYEDFRQAFVDELALATGEEGVRSLDDHLSNVQGAADCQMRSACSIKMREAVDMLAEDLRRDDLESARSVLQLLEKALCGEDSVCQDDACSKAGVQTVNQVRIVLDVYERVRARLREDGVEEAAMSSNDHPSPEGMELALAPLANARRLEALRALAGEDLSLSELARRLGIRTGHLQFHVRVLRDAELVTTVKGRRLYSITSRGRAALGLAELMTSSLAKAPS